MVLWWSRCFPRRSLSKLPILRATPIPPELSRFHTCGCPDRLQPRISEVGENQAGGLEGMPRGSKWRPGGAAAPTAPGRAKSESQAHSPQATHREAANAGGMQGRWGTWRTSSVVLMPTTMPITCNTVCHHQTTIQTPRCNTCLPTSRPDFTSPLHPGGGSNPGDALPH